MSNITLAVEDGLLDRVRALAARQGTTVSALVREHFERLIRNEDGLAEAKRELRLLSENTEVDLGPNYRFDRNEIYGDRDFPRRGFREEE